MSIENDIIFWFDTKTDEELSENDKIKMINEMRGIANNYGFDFNMCGSPESVKNLLSFIDFDYVEESEV